ncbi:mucin-17-like [Patiria miniata]|uniref:Uncharacterized protein n=1 Tax=Patiria miniata TaxID=46514 RepID=A0A913Z6Z6_PATMI|nr:mucin-17-like [Patiria miniata]
MALHPRSPLLLFQIILFLSAVFAGSCCPSAAGWQREGDFCFKIVNFNSQGQRVNWATALGDCRDDGGQLASIHSAQQQYYLHENLVDTYEYWIGLNDQDDEGTYMWVDGTDTNVFFWNENKSPAEPDGGNGEDCVFISNDEGNLQTDMDNAWGDRNCNVKMNYICGEPAYVLVPDVENQCVDAGQASVSLNWMEVTAVDKEMATVDGPITCADSGGGTSITLMGGDFGLGSHILTCSVGFSDGSTDSSSFTFSVAAFPSLTVPTVSTQTLEAGQSTVTVTWDEVTATDSDSQPITCSDSGDGTSLSVTGGVFGLGPHTIICEVTNLAGCLQEESFTFEVTESVVQTTTEELTTPHFKPTTEGSMKQPTTSKMQVTKKAVVLPTTDGLVDRQTTSSNHLTTAEVNKPTTNVAVKVPTTPNVQPTTEEVNQPTTAQLMKRPTTSSNQQTTEDVNKPTTDRDMKGPTTENIQPTTEDIQPTTDGPIDQRTTLSNQQTTMKVIQLATTMPMNGLTTSSNHLTTVEVNKPTTNVAMNVPTTPNVQLTTEDAILLTTDGSVDRQTTPNSQPTTEEVNQPTTAQLMKRPTTSSNQQTTEDVNKPTTDRDMKGPTTENIQPTTGDIQPTTDGPIDQRTTSSNQQTTMKVIQLTTTLPMNGLTTSNIQPTTKKDIQPTTDGEMKGATTSSNLQTTDGVIYQTTDREMKGPTTANIQPTTKEALQPTTDGVMNEPTTWSNQVTTVGHTTSSIQQNSDGMTSASSTESTTEGLKTVSVELHIRGVNGTALNSSDFTDPNSVASMELAELVARVIARELGENATTSDVESVSGSISIGPDGVVFTGDVFVPVDSPVTAETIMQILSNRADAGPLTDGQSTLDVVTARSLILVTIVLNIRGVNGTALNSSDYTDPNSAASMELAELVARVIARELGENATTSDVESVNGSITIGPDGVVFTGDVFVPVDSPVTAETIMQILSNQAAAGPLTDGQSTLDVVTARSLRSVSIVLNIRGVNGTALNSSDYTDPNSAASMELAELVARVIARELGENATTGDIESVNGSISIGPDGVVFTGDVFVPVDSPVTAETIMQILSNRADAGPLTDGQSTLDVVTARSLILVTIVLNIRGVNGTALNSSDYTDPNSAASMELAELVARVIARELGENATTSDVESVNGSITIGPDGVVFTGDVFVPVDSPVPAETIMQILSNQAAAGPLTDGQSTLDVVTARSLRSVSIVLNIRGVNGTALNSSDYTDPNSAASMELAELVARVIARELGENATTGDIESVNGSISIGPDGVVFTGDVFVPVDSPVTAETIMQILSNRADAGPLTDGQSTLDVVTARSLILVTIVLNIRGVNGTALNSSDYTDPNSAASMELAELVARVIARELGENATTSDVESVNGSITIGPDGVVFTGDVFVPVDSPVPAETIMQILSNQAAAGPLTDGQSTLDVVTARSLRSVSIVLNIRGVNGTALNSSDYTDPNSAASMELAELVARVIARELGENATTGDIESVNGSISIGPDGVVFTGDVFVPVDSPVTAETIMQILSNRADAGPLTDGQSTLDVVTARSLILVTIVLNIRGVNGTALNSSDYTDPNSAASMELAELVARVIARELGENATTSDVESVNGSITIGPDGVVFTGDVFVPVDSPVPAETIMQILSNQAAAGPLTDGQSTLDVVTARSLRSVSIVLNIRGVNGTALNSSDYTDPNSAASMELAELVARVIARELGENATTGDIESVNGSISIGPDGVVFTGDVFVPVDSPVTAETIMQILSNQADAGPLTDGQSTLDAVDAMGLRSVSIVLNIRGVNGTALNSSDFTDPNSAASIELAELVARVIARELGENATTSDVESVNGSISIGTDGVVFTGDVFVPVDSPVTAETIMQILSNQAGAGPLTDGQSTLDAGDAMDLRSVSIVLNIRGVNGTALNSSDYTDPNSTVSVELAELVTRVIARELGENATTGDVASVSGSISIGPDGVVFTGNVFVPVDSPVTAETIMQILSNQADAGPLTDGQSTLDVVTARSLRSVSIVLDIRGVNGTALNSSDYVDPNSAASMELAELVARVIARSLRENATTSDVESVNGWISIGTNGIVFTGDVFVPVDSPVTAETIMQILSNQADAGPLTDGQSTLDAGNAMGLRSVSIVLNIKGVNGTALNSSDFTDPNSAASVELAELVARVIARELGENATTSDVESVNGSISVETDGVVFTGDVFVPLDSTVTAETIMQILSNQADAGPLTDGQSTLDAGDAMDLKSVSIVLNIRGVNGTALNSSDYTDPNSAASMELAELVARVIARELGENATTSDVESVNGRISIGTDGVVFTGDVFVPVDSPVTAETIMQILSNQADAGPLTDGQSTLEVVTARSPISVTIVLNIRGVNGTALNSSDYTDPNSAASMELAELVARVIAHELGENATTSDVESVNGSISIGTDGVVFTGDVFVPVDSPVTAETIMQILSNRVDAGPLTDGQSTLDAGDAMDLRSVSIVLNIRRLNGTALNSSDYTDPNSAASMELAELVARVIARELGENVTTGDVKSVNGLISNGQDGVVFTGDVIVPVDSPVTAEIIMQILSNQAAAGPLTDGQSKLDLVTATSLRSVSIVLNIGGDNGTALNSSDYIDPNSATSMELAELVARVIARELGENATTSDVESVNGSISIGPDGVVFTGDVFVPVDSPVTADIIMQILSNQANARPLTDGQSTLDLKLSINDMVEDHCDPNPCMNGGTCEVSMDSHSCICVEGFTGHDCDTDIDNCDPNPCPDGESCVDGLNSFSCVDTCVDNSCETDPCAANPVLCTATPGQYCLPAPFEERPARYRCACRELDGFFLDSSTNNCTQNGFRAVTIELNVEGINGTELLLENLSEPELLSAVAGVIQAELRRLAATSGISRVFPILVSEKDGVMVFTGVIQVPADSNITAAVIESSLAILSSSRPLTDGQTTLNVNSEVTAMVSTTACPSNFCQNGGTCDVSGQYPVFEYTCRCSTGFTGSNCESIIPVQIDEHQSPTPTVSVAPLSEQGSISQVAAVFLLVGAVALVLLLLGIWCCLVYRLRKRRQRSRRVMYESQYTIVMNPMAGKREPNFLVAFVASGQEAEVPNPYLPY